MQDAVLGVDNGDRGASNGGQSGQKSRYLPPHLRSKPGGDQDTRPQRDIGDDRNRERGGYGGGNRGGGGGRNWNNHDDRGMCSLCQVNVWNSSVTYELCINFTLFKFQDHMAEMAVVTAATVRFILILF